MKPSRSSPRPTPGLRVLEVGCGTGAVTQRLLDRGALVEAIDQSPDMLELARSRLLATDPDRLTLHERTAAELDQFPAERFDAVVASLVLSEMSNSERAYVLRQAYRLLRPGGVLAVGDEVRAPTGLQRSLQIILRLPLLLLTWVLTGTTTQAIPDLAGELASAGFRIGQQQHFARGTLAVLEAERPTQETGAM